MTRDEYRREMRSLMREATEAKDDGLHRMLARHRAEPKEYAERGPRALDGLARDRQASAEAWPLTNEARAAMSPPSQITVTTYRLPMTLPAEAFIEADGSRWDTVAKEMAEGLQRAHEEMALSLIAPCGFGQDAVAAYVDQGEEGAFSDHFIGCRSCSSRVAALARKRIAERSRA